MAGIGHDGVEYILLYKLGYVVGDLVCLGKK